MVDPGEVVRPVLDTGGDGPPIVLTADASLGGDMFASQVAELVRTHRVIVWCPDAAAATTGPSDAADVVASGLFAVLDHLGIERATLLGLGAGGHLTLRAALLQPDRVRGLVLIDTDPASAAGNLTGRIPELDAPTLLLRSEHGPVSTAATEALRDALHECRGLVVLPGTPIGAVGPCTSDDADGALNHHLRTFLDDLPG